MRNAACELPLSCEESVLGTADPAIDWQSRAEYSRASNYEGTLMTRLVLALCGVALLGAIAVGGASAFTRPAGVQIAACIFSQGGQTTVPAGTDVVLDVGDISLRRGQAEAARHNWSFALANLDGTPIANPDNYWNAPTPVTDVLANGTLYPNAWATWWIYDTGITLVAGESITLDYDLVSLHPGTDGFSPVSPAGLIVGGTCTITGT
jgi:hypothetical protein